MSRNLCLSVLPMLALAGSAIAQPVIQPATNLAAALEKAQRGGMMVIIIFTQQAHPQAQKWEKELFANKDFVENAQRFSLCRLEVNSPQAKTYNLDTTVIPHTVFAYPDGKEIIQFTGPASPAQMVLAMGAAMEKVEVRFLEAMEKDLASKNPTVVAAAVGRVGQLRSKKATEVLLDFVKRGDAPDGVRKAAAEGLGRQGKGAEELVPLVSHKNAGLRTAAQQAMTKIGAPSVPFVLDGLESESPEHRVACFGIARAVTKYNKAKDAKFWQTGDEAQRKAAVTEWKEWWEKTKPPVATPIN